MDDDSVDELAHVVNRWYWEDLARAHEKRCAQLTEAVVNGVCTLRRIELDAVGDPRGKQLLHLLCHLGHDSIGWAHLGALVVAADASASALSIALQVADRCGVKIDFQRVTVPDYPAEWLSRFDIIVMTYGTLAWLPNLFAWAKLCAACLAPNGRLVVIDDHPLTDCLRVSDDGRTLFMDKTLLPDRKDGLIGRRTVGSYLDRDVEIPTPIHYRWHHSIASLRSAIGRAGLVVARRCEYRFTHYARYPGLILRSDGYYEFPKLPPCPLMLSVVAVKPCQNV